MQEENTQQPSQELQDRVKKFNEEVMPLLEKYNLSLAAEPFIHQGRIVAKPIVLDKQDTQKDDKQPDNTTTEA